MSFMEACLTTDTTEKKILEEFHRITGVPVDNSTFVEQVGAMLIVVLSMAATDIHISTVDNAYKFTHSYSSHRTYYGYHQSLPVAIAIAVIMEHNPAWLRYRGIW